MSVKGWETFFLYHFSHNNEKLRKDSLGLIQSLNRTFGFSED